MHIGPCLDVIIGVGWILTSGQKYALLPRSLISRDILALIFQGEDSYGATEGAGEHLVHLRFPNCFHFISRNGSTKFCEQAGTISISPLPKGEGHRPGPRTDRPFTFNHRERSLRWVMSYGRSHLNDYLPQINLANASPAVRDEDQELHRTRRILDLIDTLGSAWKGIDYNPRQVLSNQVGKRYILLQFSNGCLQNNMYPNQQLEDASVLEGPCPLLRWEGRGQ